MIGEEAGKKLIKKAMEERERAKKGLERRDDFETLSWVPVKRIYTPEDVRELNYDKDVGRPGEYPYTRGIYPNMFRGRIWTIRMFSGLGGPEDTNRRWKELMAHGETGLSTAFDFPTINGIDSDDPLALGEVGRCGVSVCTFEDMESLFSGIRPDEITVNFTINTPAEYILASYFALAKKRGIPISKVGGTTQNDSLKDFYSQKHYRFSPEAHLYLNTDLIRYCTKNAPLWNTISISGYHIREAGSTALQELAWTIADGVEFVRYLTERWKMDVDSFAPRLSFFWNAHDNFFEEVAKFRAARKIWAEIMRDWFGAKNPRSLMCRFHVQTGGCTLTYQYPETNIARVAIQGMAAVLGGCQSLHTDSYDEAICTPTDKAADIATLTQRILAYEIGATDTVDPLGGSYYVEWLTREMTEGAMREIEKIEKMGGATKAILDGYFWREIAKSASEYQGKIEKNEIIKVGVNDIKPESMEYSFEPLRIPLDLEEKRRKWLKEYRENRDGNKIDTILDTLRKTAEEMHDNKFDEPQPMFEHMYEAVNAKATMGEVMYALEDVFGRFREPPIF